MKKMISTISKHLACLSLIICFSQSGFSQQYLMQKGLASFTVSAPAKTIQGESRQVKTELDIDRGSVQLQVAVESFQFTSNYLSEAMNETLYERFNSYYMESDKYPMITYSAQILNPEEIHWEKDGVYPIKTAGTVKIHGVEQQIESNGHVTIKGKVIGIKADMTVYPIQYRIRIPSYIGDMYFKKVLIEVNGTFVRHSS